MWGVNIVGWCVRDAPYRLPAIPLPTEALTLDIRAMTSEELYYWFIKCASHASTKWSQKAHRILLWDKILYKCVHFTELFI